MRTRVILLVSVALKIFIIHHVALHGQEKPAGREGHFLRVVPQCGHATTTDVFVDLTHDGKWAVTHSGADGTARLWDLSTGFELRQFVGHTGPVQKAIFSRDKTHLVTSSRDRTIRIWDVIAGKQTRVFCDDHGFNLIALSDDGKWLVALTGNSFRYDDRAHIWEVATSKKVAVIEINRKEQDVTSVALSHDGKWLAVGGRDCSARLWDVKKGREVRAFRKPMHRVTALAFSPDGKLLVTAGWDNVARLWEIESGLELQVFQGHEGFVNCARFSPDGGIVATGGQDATARFWDVVSGKQVKVFRHNSPINSVAISDHGNRLACGENSQFNVWNVNTEKKIFVSPKCAVDAVANIFGGNRWLISACRTPGDDNTRAWHFWDLEKGREEAGFWNKLEENRVVSASKYADRILTYTDDTFQIWDVAKRMIIKKFEIQDVVSAELSPDGRMLIVLQSGKVSIRNVATGNETRSLSIKGVTGAAVSLDGKWLVAHAIKVVNETQIAPRLCLWDVIGGKEVRSFASGELINSGKLILDGKWLLTRSADYFKKEDYNSLRLWDLATGRQAHSFEGHCGGITCVEITSDGKGFVTGSYDSTARVWEMNTATAICVCRGHTSTVTSVIMNLSGNRLLTSSSDQTIRLWDIPSGKELCQLISFRDGTWAVIDSDGRYDSAKNGEITGIKIYRGNQILSVPAGKAHLYDPGLLSKHLGFNKERLRNIDGGK